MTDCMVSAPQNYASPPAVFGGVSDTETQPKTTSLDTLRITRHLPSEEGHRFVTMICTNCGHNFKFAIDCGDRCCPVCQKRRRKRIIDAYTPVVKAMRHPLFITLTIPRTQLTRGLITHIRNSFTKLRHKKIWHNSVLGGIYQIELGTVDDLGGCNVHIHTIADGDYIPQKELSAEWLKVSGGSIVDIRECSDVRDALGYLTKHMGKSFLQDGWDRKMLRDLINRVLKDTRMVQSYGTVKVNLRCCDVVCPECHAVNSYTVLEYENLKCDIIDGLCSDRG